jgi:hypothetical protein
VTRSLRDSMDEARRHPLFRFYKAWARLRYRLNGTARWPRQGGDPKRKV